MSVLNEVRIVGALVKDPDRRETPSGCLVTEMTVAVKQVRWDREAGCDVIEQVFLAVVGWEDVAATMRGLCQGTVVHVTGQLTQQEITDADGKKNRKTKIRAWVVDVIRTPNN